MIENHAVHQFVFSLRFLIQLVPTIPRSVFSWMGFVVVFLFPTRHGYRSIFTHFWLTFSFPFISFITECILKSGLTCFLFKLEFILDYKVETHACDKHKTNRGSFLSLFLSYSLRRSYIEAVNWNHYVKKLPKYYAIIALRITSIWATSTCQLKVTRKVKKTNGRFRFESHLRVIIITK